MIYTALADDAGHKVDGMKPAIEFPLTALRMGIESTIKLTDAIAKMKQYGAIGVDGSSGAAADCDTAAKAGSGNVTALTTPNSLVSYAYTIPAGSAGRGCASMPKPRACAK